MKISLLLSVLTIWLCWLIVYSSGESSESDNEDGGRVDWGNIYKKSAKPVLVLPLDLYLLLKSISVGISRPSFYPILYCLLSTSTTDYCLKRIVNNFGLKRLFYSKQNLKDACYSLM